MATDQPTDARLRERVLFAVSVLARCLQIGPCPAPDGHTAEIAAALDTLIRYHEAKGAVEVLTETVLVLCTASCGHPRSTERCWPQQALAAAQERLAAYSVKAQ